MNVVQLVQGSPEWLACGLPRRYASESAAVLGVSPWTTPYRLRLLKPGRSITKVTATMQHPPFDGGRGAGHARIAGTRPEREVGTAEQRRYIDP